MLACLYLCFLAVMAFSAACLPDPVAVHFTKNGAANGWMRIEEHAAFSLFLAVVLPLPVVGIFYSLRFMPDKLINLPNRDRWLAQERRAETFAFLLGHSLWFACFSLAFVIGVDLLIVEANAHFPARLSLPISFLLLGGFAASLLAWTLRLALHFRR